MRRAFTLIELMIVIAIIAIIAAIAIPNLLEARKHGNEASAIGSLRTLNASMAIYIERNASQRYATTLADLETDGYIDNVLGSGAKQGYLFKTFATDDLFSGSPPPGPTLNYQYEYLIGTKPAVDGQTGDRYFASNQSGVIHFTNSADLAGGVLGRPIGGK
jgi:type IV pilus assembly protein PilA